MLRQRLLALIFGCFLIAVQGFAANADEEFRSLVSSFKAEYSQLKIPELSLSYVENFKNIQSLNGINRQRTFFRKYRHRLSRIHSAQLDQESQFQYDALLFQIRLDLERTSLERRYKQHEPSSIPDGGLHAMPHGRDWYHYYVKKWATQISPQTLFRFGTSEVERVRKQMRTIQKNLGFEGKDSEFYAHLNDKIFEITNESQLRRALLGFQDLILKNLSADFEKTDIPKVDVQPIPKPTQDSPPGYYEDGVFYYNFYQGRFPARSLEWLFIHEAIPGHHYQGESAQNPSPFQKLFWYPGFSEGWAAYTEDLGWDLGAYQDPYLAYGKWEWDLVRSARIVLDVGINYLGWSKTEALNYWRKNIPNQDTISEREVDRIFRWPCQVLAYKVGENEIAGLRRWYLENKGDLKAFHAEALRRGSIPLTTLRRVILSRD